MTPTDQFCRILRERSSEHRAATRLLFPNGLYGQMISILRQELDSMIRAIFLIHIPVNARQHYINQTLNNEKWTMPNSRTAITDRQMVDFANQLFGWTKSVYKLGCAFIHLSPMADYNNTDPFLQIATSERQDIQQHLHHYHGFPLSDNLSIITVGPYLQRVFVKIADNLEYEIQGLENNKVGHI